MTSAQFQGLRYIRDAARLRGPFPHILRAWGCTAFYCLVLLAFAMSSASDAENWDRFRGPNGAGQSDAVGIPTRWTPAGYLWETPLPGIGVDVASGDLLWSGLGDDLPQRCVSSPIVAGGMVFVSCGPRNALDEPCVATPAVANHRLFIRTASSLVCIGQP